MSDPEHRCGFAALVGRPNTGKSTLLNKLVAQELSIVSPKPQTTRHRILGIHNEPRWQIIFVDTPGIHRDGGRALNRYMNRTATNSLVDADVQVLVVEAMRWQEEDQDVLERAQQAGGRMIAVVNKIDLHKPRDTLLPYLKRLAERGDFEQIIPISARRGENIDRLVEVVGAALPLSPAMFPPDQLTDRGEHFRVAELVRQKLTLRLRQEIPYGLTVQIEQYEEHEGIMHISAVIYVERKGQKGIVVGKGGLVLKEVGRAARLSLKARLNQPVDLRLWVKVKDNWADNDAALRSLGYDPS